MNRFPFVFFDLCIEKRLGVPFLLFCEKGDEKGKGCCIMKTMGTRIAKNENYLIYIINILGNKWGGNLVVILSHNFEKCSPGVTMSPQFVKFSKGSPLPPQVPNMFPIAPLRQGIFFKF
jgi:hypothetical protein